MVDVAELEHEIETEAAEQKKPPREKKIPVVEIFGPTTQGEGLVAGMRTVFIRFGLCDYKCTMCDSMHAVDPARVKANARWMTQVEIAEAVVELCSKNNCWNVTFSGGNPCIHDLSDLVFFLQREDLTISVETQGTKFPDWLGDVDFLTVSPKSPGMGEKFELEVYKAFMDRMIEFSTFSDLRCCVKIVVFSAQDLQFAADVAGLYPIVVELDLFYLSLGNPFPPGQDVIESYPGSGKTLSLEALRAELTSEFDVIQEEIKDYPILGKARLLPQLHVLLWGNKQGV